MTGLLYTTMRHTHRLTQCIIKSLIQLIKMLNTTVLYFVDAGGLIPVTLRSLTQKHTQYPQLNIGRQQERNPSKLSSQEQPCSRNVK